ncbi:hypothetical protein ANO11243_066530 [Dothideomycetidae sp. 11243]|nr:hypothetical protein ANO11243_066530 [fungal sp. No.11243]
MEKSYFEQQRAALINEIATVGNEFSQVEGLWAQFENVMARPEEDPRDDNGDATEGNAR